MSSSLTKILDDFRKVNALVVGDVMIDTYVFGSANRTSPEAPVPVVDVEKTESRPGGAANVAMNIQSLGGKAELCSVTGNDAAGKLLSGLLKKNKIKESGFKSAERTTTEKTRIFSRNHQMLRCDREMTDNLSAGDEGKLLNSITRSINSGKFNVVILQDYNKGVLTPKVIHETTALCWKKKIPVAVDPKEKNFFEYKNVSLFKPNLREVTDALKITVKCDRKSLEKTAHMLQAKLEHRITLITLSENGAFITDHKNSELIPAAVRQVSDVSGAGDTVLSVAAMCLALETDFKTIGILANIAGGLACEQVGAGAISKEKFLASLKASEDSK